jgi:probable F420-dependent oxidoreductase
VTALELGVLFPQTEIGTDPIAVRDFAQAAEELGYTHLLAFEHVLGVDPATRDSWDGYYTHRAQFHEPFVLFGYLAAHTSRIIFATSVLVTPQRQTALVAKQAAAVDVLSGGRLRLGIGIGWNADEYDGLGADFSTRGLRSEEQIRLLRALWTQESVEFDGRWDRLHGLGISPLPVQRPIPIWIGGGAPAVLERVGRLADGWYPFRIPPHRLAAGMEEVRAAARAAGRDPSAIGVQGLLWSRTQNERDWSSQLDDWRRAGCATHVAFVTVEAGFQGVNEHIAAMTRFRDLATDAGL